MAEAALTRRTGSVAVIGAGIFGVTAALELAAAGADVTLYERRQDILAGTTASNFFRLHRGYHYPRDLATAAQARDGFTSFTRMFAGAMTPRVPHYYAIAAEGSLTTADQFAWHCGRLGLRADPVRAPFLVPGSVSACFEVDEAFYDPAALRRLCRKYLARSAVQVEAGSTRSPAAIGQAHDVVVVAAYAGLNEVLAGLGAPTAELQYEMCEVSVIRAPGLPAVSLVVMDGPFMSVAPYRDGMHVLYDVVHSVRARSAGHAAPGAFAAWPAFPEMLASARRFVPLGDVRLVRSLRARRVVLPGVDATDARRTDVAWVSPRVLSVLSGKVCTSAGTARLVAAEVTAKLGGCNEPDRVSSYANVGSS